MEKITVVVFKDDGQWDVEVYGWNENEHRADEVLKKETAYALQTEEEVEEQIKQLRNRFIVKNIEYVDAENGEQMTTVQSILPKPLYITYEFDEEELVKVLENELLFNLGVSLKLSLSCEHEYMSIEIKKNSNKTSLDEFYRCFRESDEELVDKFILNTVFGNRASYTYVEREDIIFIHKPYSSKTSTSFYTPSDEEKLLAIEFKLEEEFTNHKTRTILAELLFNVFDKDEKQAIQFLKDEKKKFE